MTICRLGVLAKQDAFAAGDRFPCIVAEKISSDAGRRIKCRSVFEANKSGLFRYFSLQSGPFDIILYRLQLFLPARRKGGVAPGVLRHGCPGAEECSRGQRPCGRTNIRKNTDMSAANRMSSRQMPFCIRVLSSPRFGFCSTAIDMKQPLSGSCTGTQPCSEAGSPCFSFPTSRHGWFFAHAGVFCTQKHLPAVSFSLT